MKWKQNKLKITSLIFYILLLGFVLFIIRDRTNKSFVFHKGDTWLYEDLYAEHDFAILKADEEIQAERDSILNSVLPVFIYDTTGINKFINDFSKGLDNIFTNYDELIENKTLVLKLYSKLFFFKKSVDSVLFDSYFKIGLIDTLENFNQKPVNKINIYNGKYYVLANYTDFYTAEKLKTEIKKVNNFNYLDSIFKGKIDNYLNNINFPSNYVFSDSITSNLINIKLNSISPYYGMVKKGDLIIQKGNIIGESEYRILNTLQKQNEQRFITGKLIYIYIGYIIIFGLFFGVLIYYIWNFQNKKLSKIRDIIFTGLLFFLMILSVYLIFKFTDFNLNVIPYALFPLLLISFYSFHTAFFFYLFMLLISSFFASNGFEFLFMHLLAGIISMYSLKIRNRRSQIFKTMFLVLFTYLFLDLGFKLIKLEMPSFQDFKNFLPYIISSILILLYFPLLYIFEKTFGFISDYTLLELCDTNNPLLRQLAEKAPGTFQHSVQLANIVENIIRELKGNSLLARTGALYHDVGKLMNPEYFIENQSGFNIHDTLDYEDSAQKIIAHVSDGVKLAKKHNIPSQIIDFILMHHGTTITKYFYSMWKKDNPNLKPIESNFRYPGPKPNSLETAVLMMADGIEAASRTLKDFSQESIEKLVNNIIDSQVQAGQFDNVDLTFREITKAKTLFIANLKSVYHGRIVYPD